MDSNTVLAFNGVFNPVGMHISSKADDARQHGELILTLPKGERLGESPLSTLFSPNACRVDVFEFIILNIPSDLKCVMDPIFIRMEVRLSCSILMN